MKGVRPRQDLEVVKALGKGQILIVGGIYDLHSGKVEFLKETLMNLPMRK